MPVERRPPVKVLVLVILAAIGVCLIAAAMMDSVDLGVLGGWPGVVAGFVLLTVSIGGLWITQRERDRTLR
jgi:predicted tellurium resistance membrane protein TerC